MTGCGLSTKIVTMKRLSVRAKAAVRRMAARFVFDGADGKRELSEKNRRLRNLRRQLEKKDRELDGLRAAMAGRWGETGGIRAGDVVWIFGAGRTGSTWLSRMMGEMENHSVWFEPGVGELFGYLYYARSTEGQHNSFHFVLGRNRESWLGSMRAFILGEAGLRFPELARKPGKLVVKEPHGSIGAPLLMDALPESCMVLLIRDPRDVAASYLDAYRSGGWEHEKNRGRARSSLADERPDEFVRETARTYLRYMGNARRAYEAHTGRKSLVRYEELRSNTLETMRRIYKDLRIEVEDEELAAAVKKHSWESLPEDERGKGKFYRKASPGGWREDLTERQINIVEEVTAPVAGDLYFGP